MEIKEKTIRYIELDGINFYKSKAGYWFGSRAGEKPVRLHVYVWEKQFGKSLKGTQIHHIDGDKDNNEIENLIMLDHKAHDDIHSEARHNTGKQNIKKAIVAARDWHKSPEGSEWHKKHYLEHMAPKWKEMITKSCLLCGKEFETPSPMANKATYCSAKCKATARRRSGVDNIWRPCDTCGKQIWTNKYSPSKFCSTECLPKRRKLNTDN